ncbi:transcription initiation factor TFIIE alpha subunit [Ceratobasidium sp. AG-Ba]|nr:transcription initiation factor TFIIE alpha subunit [Ceratobasidium sp. AG-Ba]
MENRIKEEELAGRVGVTMKELNKVTAVLLNDKLIQVYRQNELKSERAQRAVPRSYYWIDYQHFCNVVKWRISAMRRSIEQNFRNELDNKGYICTQCQHVFEQLDASRLAPDFLCDICGAQVQENENAENVLGGKDRMQRFNTQTLHIVDALRKVESTVLTPFDVADWVRKNVSIAAPDGTPVDDGLQIAGANGTGKAQLTKVSVILEDDKTDEALRREREKKADAKRQQNALPEWHLQSTVSGHKTALGLKNEAQNAQYASAVVEQTPLDKKPFTHGEIDLDEYYSSLNKQEGSGSGASTPMTGSQSSFLGKREREEVQLSENDSRASKMQKTDENDETNPLVSVAGNLKRFRDVTEEEHEKMTEKEYEAYAELMVKLS